METFLIRLQKEGKITVPQTIQEQLNLKDKRCGRKNTKMQRIFADSSVLIAGAASRTGASRAILTMVEIGLFKLVISQQILKECHPNLNKKLPEALPVFNQLVTYINPEILPDPSFE